jgi:sortase A
VNPEDHARLETAERAVGDIAIRLLERARESERQLDEAIRERDELRRAVAAQTIVVRDPPRTRARPGVADGRLMRGALLVALATGTLAVADAFLTIVWQEPVTGLFAGPAREALDRDLTGLTAAFALPSVQLPALTETSRAKDRRLAARLLGDLRTGEVLGSISIPRIALRTPLVEGTGTDELSRAPGHYRSTTLPGLPGTFALAGHRTTHGAPFRHLDRLSEGDRVTVRMPYGEYVYAVRGSRVVSPTTVSDLRRRSGPGTLVLTACHPVGSAAQRIVVTADRIGARSRPGVAQS